MGRGGGVQADPKFSWLSRPSPATTERFDQAEDNDDSTDRDENGPSSTPSRSAATSAAAAAAATAPALSPRAQRGRVATALDRMGAAVMEVRDAFQRWVPHEGPSVAAARSSSNQAVNKRAVSFSDGNKTSLAGLKEAMVRAMTDLRLPLETATDFCERVGGGEAAVTFSDFLSRYADASGLLKDISPSGNKGGRDVWVEGSAGVWVAVPLKELRDARREFDEQAAKQADQDQGSKSDDEGELVEVRRAGEHFLSPIP